MRQKRAPNISTALGLVKDGDVIFFGGFGRAGVPVSLILGLAEMGLKDLTIVANGGGEDDSPMAEVLKCGAVRKVICTFPYARDSAIFRNLYHSGKIELELVPQGTLAERIRNAGSGLGGFLTPTALGTEIAKGKPHIEVEGKTYVLEKPLHADIALIKANKADPRGNLTYRQAARNFNPLMAMAARYTVALINKEVSLGDINPTEVVTPGIYVDCYVIDTGNFIE